jgi:CheY-like chemotaxis protein
MSTTRKHGGTGLGLAISKGLVEARGGAIGVSSIPGAGSLFHLSLPLVAEAEREEPAGGIGDGASIAGLSVMVVDDNPTNRELARRILEALEAQVTTAESGAEALGLLGGRPVDVVLMDLRMPGMDGRAALAALRAADGPNRATPVLAFTADAELGDDAGLDAFDGVVRKPIDPVQLTARLAAAAVRPDAGDQAVRATA